MIINKEAMKESLSDTFIATIINFPLNWFLISVAFYVKMNALETAIFCTSILFVIAIIRKYMVRIHFANRKSNA